MTILLLTRPGGILVSAILDALADGDRLPDRVILTGLDPDSDEVAEARSHPLISEHPLDFQVRPVLPAREGTVAPVAEVVADALAATPRPVRDEDWWWILTDDARPEPNALGELVDATRRSTGVGIVGPKLLDRDDPRVLVAMGYQLTCAGRTAGSPRGEIDQGQYDKFSDTLGVPLPGMFVRRSVLDDLGGLDPAFDQGTEGLDLSWRAHLADHRVVIAPGARIAVGPEGLGVGRPWRTRLRTRQLALARGSLWALPWRTVSILVVSLLGALGLLLVKRPRDAAGELADVVAVLSPARGLAARWRNRHRVTVKRRHLSSLFDTSATAWRGTADLVHDAFTPSAASARRRAGTAVETGPISDDAQGLDSAAARSWWSWPMIAGLLVVLGLTLIRWRDLLPGLSGSAAGVSGGELSVQTAGSSDLWSHWWGAWSGSGLGQAVPSEPWWAPMTGLTWLVEHLPWVSSTAASAGLASAYLLLAAMPLSYLSCVLAARLVTDRRWPRVVAALAWAVLPPLSASLAEARIGPVVVHILAPLIVAGVVASLSRGPGSVRTAAAFGTALATGVAALFVPATAIVVSLAGLTGLIIAPGAARLRAVVLVVVPWLLTGPWLALALENPRLLWGGAGATVTGADVDPWRILLLDPGAPTSPLLWWTLPILVLALVGTLRSGARGARLTALALGGVVVAGLAVALTVLSIGPVPEGFSNAGAPVGAWPGSLLSLAGAAFVLAAAGAVRTIDARWSGADWRRSGVSVAAGIAAVSVVALAVTAAWAGHGPLLRVAERPHLAVADASAHGGDATRILTLEPGPTVVRYTLDGRESRSWMRDLSRDLTPATATTRTMGDSAEDQVANVAALLVGRQQAGDPVDPAVSDTATDSEADTDTVNGTPVPRPDDIQHQLHDLAIGYVQARTTAESALAEQLDAIPGLVRLGGTDETQIWRVIGLGDSAEFAPVRIRIDDADGDPAGSVPVQGAHSRTDTEIPDAPPGGSLEISQSQQWTEYTQVRIDGTLVPPTPRSADDATQQIPVSYPLPDGGGVVEVEISVEPADMAWRVSTAVIAVVVAFLALPFGARRRSQR